MTREVRSQNPESRRKHFYFILFTAALTSGFWLLTSDFFPSPASAEDTFEFTVARIASAETHSAVIEWQTNLPSNGRIDYGEDLNTANKVALEVNTDTTHHTLLFGLREGEGHVFRVFATDTGNRQIRTNWMSFRTQGIPAPKVLAVSIKDLTWQGAKVEWRSNIPLKGFFECGYDTSYGYSKKEATFGLVHEVALDRFSARRTIYYRITAKDERGKQIDSYLATFQTDENNIAVGSFVKGTFTLNPEPNFISETPPLLQRVTDGKLNYFHGMATSGDPASDSQWVEIDFGTIKDVSEILTCWRKLAYPKQFSVKASLDGERWYDFGDTFSAETGRTAVSGSGDPLFVHSVPIGNYTLRYIRVEIPKGAPFYKKFETYNFVQLFEVKAYPPEVEDGFMMMRKRASGRK